MQKIKLLPQEIIARIAAGEVIERPAYAIKELIDNSIDASADTLTIHLEESGLQKIILHDNGNGMSKEDLLESYKLHTTSKIHSINDLSTIHSFGFRGEALASIAAMADVTIQSRTRGQYIGNEIVLQNGELIALHATGMPAGTTVIISNIFANTPGRKNFLNNPVSELRFINEIVIHQAIAHPEVTFTLYHNERELLNAAATKIPYDRLQLLFSRQQLRMLLPIQKSAPYVSLQGFISLPSEGTRVAKQHIYINQRHVKDNDIVRAIRRGYDSLLPPNKQAVFVLFLKIPDELVDSNIHPRKEQVALSHKSAVLDIIENIVRETLQEVTPINYSFSKEETTSSFAGKLLKANNNDFLIRDSEQQSNTADPLQIHKTFLLIPQNNGFLLIDQHAAHERILYEQYTNLFRDEQNKLELYVLPEPVNLDLPAVDMQLLKEYAEVITKLGFVLRQQAEKVFITAVPVLFQDRDYKSLLLELLNSEKLDGQSHRMLAYLACRKAVKAGDSLQAAEIRRLYEQLKQTEHNQTCPHGRPTTVRISIDELERIFKRK